MFVGKVNLFEMIAVSPSSKYLYYIFLLHIVFLAVKFLKDFTNDDKNRHIM